MIEKLEGLSTREAVKELMSLSSEHETLARPDQISALTPQLSEVRFTADQKLLDQLDELRGLLAHRSADMSLGELIAQVSAVALEKLREQRSGGRGRAPKGEITSGAETNANTRVPKSSKTARNSEASNVSKNSLQIPQKESQKDSVESATAEAPEGPHVSPPLSLSRHIPARIRRAVFKRDGLACTYQDPISGRSCGSRFALQLDHRIPFAKGGLHSADNLTARCRVHNQWAALQIFGLKKVAQHRHGR